MSRDEPTVDPTIAAQILSSTEPDQGENEQMSEQQEGQYRSISREELDAIAGEALPERAARSLVDANMAIPINAAVAANVTERGRRMAENEIEYRSLSREELEEIAGEPLPERAAMSLINANLAAPVNATVAANVLSDSSIAYANAEQTTNTDQSN